MKKLLVLLQSIAVAVVLSLVEIVAFKVNDWLLVVLLVILNLLLSFILVELKRYRRQVKTVEQYLQSLVQDGALNDDMQLDYPELNEITQSINQVVHTKQEYINQQKAIEKSKDELLTNISHDLRTPLTSIIGFLGLIEQSSDISKDQMRSYAKVAYQKSLQLQSLANDLFEYISAESNQISVDVQSFDMIQMLEQIAADFSLQAQKQNIEIIVQSQNDHLLMQADSNKLGRVFNNLVSNALKYGIGAKHIWLKVQDLDTQVILQVQNDGEPIAPEEQKYIFDRFYRVEHSRSKQSGGTGLGLAIAQKLVNIQDGTISVHSNEQLTDFEVRLPKNLTSEE